jgi:hypothetical protein
LFQDKNVILDTPTGSGNPWWRWRCNSSRWCRGDGPIRFCDFDDPTEDKVIIATARKILAAKTKLLVHTLAKRPPKWLVELTKCSGGEVSGSGYEALEETKHHEQAPISRR